jgi:hypothetical protein
MSRSETRSGSWRRSGAPRSWRQLFFAGWMRHGVLLVGAAAFAALVARVAAAEGVDNETCLSCHGTDGFADSGGRDLFISGESFNASAHAALACTTCHAGATSVPHAAPLERVGVHTCARCHGDQVAAYEESAHAHVRQDGSTAELTCKNCHGWPHYVKKANDPGSSVYPLNLPRTCGVCHGDRDFAKRHNIPITNAPQLYVDSIHGRALSASGLLVTANCSSCHGAHDIRPKTDSRSKVFRSNIPATCGACHAGVEEAYFQGIHGQALKAGRAGAPDCVDCHTAHQIVRVETDPWKLQIIKECGTCHEESLKTYRDTLHGQVTNLGFMTLARCSDCHAAHRVLPASNPASTIAPANLVETCQKCHPRANANFTRFSLHADPSSKERNPSLYYVALGMRWLTVGAFAFFGLHTVLWFGRSLHEQVTRPGPNRN